MTAKNGKAMRKRLFVGLLSISMLSLIGIFISIWWLASSRGMLINKIITNTIIAGAILLLLMLAIGLSSLIWTIWQSRTAPYLSRSMRMATRFLFPITIIIGKLLGWSEDRVKNSFIQVSNHLVKAGKYDKPIKKILILAPHCIQWVYCPHKITIDISNCKECGKCQVSELIKLARKYDIRLRIATGGTLARKAVKDIKPGAIVAIACERDLTSGIKDVSGIPVIGVINERPEGPCCNTCVDLRKVEDSINFFLKRGGK